MGKDTSSGPIEDSQRAERSSRFSLCKHSFITLLAIEDLTAIYEKYRQRTFNEDIEHLQSMGGKERVMKRS